MIWIISRFEHDMSWMKDYDDYYIIYDRSEKPMEGSIPMPNIGSDIYDKLTFIIDNYDNLPEVAIYTKANIFKYITKEEFDKIKDNKAFTPILTQGHPEIMCDDQMVNYRGKPFSFYDNGMYYELNYPAYLRDHNLRDVDWQSLRKTCTESQLLKIYKELPLVKLLGLDKMEYIPFAPGSNYILTRENILQHPKEFYIKLRSYIDWTVYSGECMILERALYSIFKPKGGLSEGMSDYPAVGVPA